MNGLKTLPKSLRQENIHHRRFIPNLALRQALTSKIVSEALDDSEISQHKRAEVATRIIHSGCKIFAILVLIDQPADVMKFIEAVELEDVRMDVFSLGLLFLWFTSERQFSGIEPFPEGMDWANRFPLDDSDNSLYIFVNTAK